MQMDVMNLIYFVIETILLNLLKYSSLQLGMGELDLILICMILDIFVCLYWVPSNYLFCHYKVCFLKIKLKNRRGQIATEQWTKDSTILYLLI